MFYLLGLALCLAVAFIVIAGTSPLCMAALRHINVRRLTPDRAANLLFLARSLPVLLALLITFGLALPAFLEFEPRSTSEMMGTRLLVLAAAGAILIGMMAVRAARMLRATQSIRRQWKTGAEAIGIQGVDLPLYRVKNQAPLLAVAGFFRPEIFVADNLLQALSPEELTAAVAHEIAHVRCFDNLKRLFLKVTAPPVHLNSFRLADRAWTNASEIAADEAAVANGISALDLSSALIKAGRLGANAMACDAVAVSQLLPALAGSPLEVRVEHLQSLLEEIPPGRKGLPGNRRYRIFVSTLLIAAVYAASINLVLPWIHEALEILVR